ncbi:hypothetical protein HPB51_011885 [Rhipicephalus microplus]|uniref:RING-type E3 ubiquitin transferase n=1 Tax=Rhipicephalus microplus TaxID=6941 RepID=A0A9J6E9C8_RHIMP|nr:uncharacterized protein LOC119164986 [Rhipicephalus microplus]KAH8030841.1 hypothetical protein HPB51_011885 [Rhipicephalus microplus]
MSSSSGNDRWQLNDYERQRSRHKLFADDAKLVPLHEDSFRRDFMCGICLDLLRNAVATTACLHRFCEECITAALRRCNNECPICRMKIRSRRELRRDHRMDILVAALVPRDAEELTFGKTRSATSGNRQLPEGTARRVENDVRECTAVVGNVVGRSSCGSETNREVDHAEEPITVGVNGPEEEANGLSFSASTLPQHGSSYEQPSHQSPTWPVYEGGNSFSWEKMGRGLSLRVQARRTQSAFSGEYEVDAHDLVPAESADGPNRKTHRDRAVANSSDVSFGGLCAAPYHGLTQGKATQVVITLKPHLDMFFQFPASPTLSVNVSGRGPHAGHIRSYQRVPLP